MKKKGQSNSQLLVGMLLLNDDDGRESERERKNTVGHTCAIVDR